MDSPLEFPTARTGNQMISNVPKRITQKLKHNVTDTSASSYKEYVFIRTFDGFFMIIEFTIYAVVSLYNDDKLHFVLYTINITSQYINSIDKKFRPFKFSFFVIITTYRKSNSWASQRMDKRTDRCENNIYEHVPL